ncbi:MAG TPA: DUF4190 domain-containing protein [Pyrinomonadaceae bacterium]|jgi:hypothetical protein
MKICPNCRQTYTDDNLNFCLTDGSFLTAVSDNEPKTVLMDQPRVTNQTNFGQAAFEPSTAWGAPQNIQQQMNYPMRVQSQNQTLATVSLVLGILSVVSVCCWGGIPLGTAAVVTGVLAMNKEKSDPAGYGGYGMSLGGVITGAVALLIGFGFLILMIIGNI